MILTCPSCGTQYAVRDGAIPPEGRKVRCAACGHSWHQTAEAQAAEASPEDSAPAPEPEQEWAPTEELHEEDYGNQEAVAQSPVDPIGPGAPLVEAPTSVPVPPPDAEQWGVQGVDESPEELAKEIPDEEEIAAAEAETPSQQRRSWLTGILIALLAVAIIALAVWFLAPDSVRRALGLAAGAPSALQIVAGTPERQQLASGNNIVVVNGRIINPSSSTQTVPPIVAQLRAPSGKVVYSWTITAPVPTLPPGGSASFNSGEVGIPPSEPGSTIKLSLNS